MQSKDQQIFTANPFDLLYNELRSIRALLEARDGLKETGQFKETDYLTMDEAAEYLKMKKNGLYRLTSKKKIPYYKPGKRIRFLKSDLTAYLSSVKMITNDQLATSLSKKN